jgi:hypothetical protein
MNHILDVMPKGHARLIKETVCVGDIGQKLSHADTLPFVYAIALVQRKHPLTIVELGLRVRIHRLISIGLPNGNGGQ